MPRRSTGPRLWFDEDRKTWTIVDRKARIRTGCGAGEEQAAKAKLGAYIAENGKPQGESNPSVNKVILAYETDVVAGKPSEKDILYDTARLVAWWGEKKVSDVTPENVRAYTAHRGGKSPCRRELGFLRTAMRHWSDAYNPIRVPRIQRPPKRLARQRWLTIEEAALFLRKLRGTRHVAHFFLLGWYTGSRATVLLRLQWDQIDLRAGLLYRQRPGTVETSKQAPPVRIGPRLLGHLRRWRARQPDSKYVIEYRGKPVDRIAKGWNKARVAAELWDVHPHVLRHSRASHLLRQRVDTYEAAESLGMSLTVFQKTYGHLHPDWQNAAANAR